MYDFKMLSDYDFELLTQDLLQNSLGCRLESFKKGKDKGIDLRYSNSEKMDIVIQCKHYANSKFSNLKSNLKNIESKKIKALNPTRYILVTSQGLTPRQKDELLQILTPHCQSTGDIYGMNDLNGLLRQFPEVEKSHYKLWLTSTPVLERITHSSVYNRSEININKIYAKLKIYVQNRAYFRALDILKESHCCIISGIPGIGKTTLAEMILITYLNMDYEVIKISQNISEAFEVYSSKKKQIFLYDDFLGQTGLDIKLHKNEDNDILTFIRYIEKEGNSKFILTTREYILNQAKSTYESLEKSNIDLKKFTLLLDDYNKHDKSKILFNHLYYNKLPKSYIENLLKNDISQIINHKNYSPRIIEILTENLLPSEPDNFYKSFIDNLNNPSKIWEFAFSNHISQNSRNLLILLISLPLKIEIESLNKIYNFYNGERSRLYNREFSESDFKKALKELDGSFINIDEGYVSFLNPSVKDFIEQYVLENDEEFKILCGTSMYFEQCIFLYNISKKNEGKLIERYKKYYVDSLLENLLSEKIRFAGGFMGGFYYSSYSSIIQRVITVMKMNIELKSKKITDYLVDNFFENLSINLDFYSSNIEDCIELLKISTKGEYSKYFNPYLIKEIFEFSINEFRADNMERIEDFEIVDVIRSNYPELISDSTMEELAGIFANFYMDDCKSFIDWGGREAIRDYSNKMENMGELFSIDVDDALEYLDEEAERLENIDEDEIYQKPRENIVEEFTDSMIVNMFDALS